MSVWLIPAILAAIGAAALVLLHHSYCAEETEVPSASPCPGGCDERLGTDRRTADPLCHQTPERVAELASAIAREMHLSKKLVKMLLMVWHRPRPRFGIALPGAQTALQYHERLNGSGYRRNWL